MKRRRGNFVDDLADMARILLLWGLVSAILVPVLALLLVILWVNR